MVFVSCTSAANYQHYPKRNLKKGIFDEPQIRKLIKDFHYEESMTNVKKKLWNSFKNVIFKFFNNTKDPSYKTIVAYLLKNLRILGYNISIKLHILNSRIDYFPEKFSSLNE